jgi:hypothetical protein
VLKKDTQIMTGNYRHTQATTDTYCQFNVENTSIITSSGMHDVSSQVKSFGPQEDPVFKNQINAKVLVQMRDLSLFLKYQTHSAAEICSARKTQKYL